MPAAGGRAYAYSKACGIVGKSFVARRLSRLSSPSRLAELDRLVFPESPLELPERELSVRFERRVAERASSRVVAVFSSLGDPPPALVRLVRAFETADLKACVAAAASQSARPETVDIGRFGTVDFDAYPDIAAMTAGTEHTWLAERVGDAGNVGVLDVQTEIDLRYYKALWAETLAMPGKGRSFEELVAQEIALKNVSWALRLRVYYGLSQEEILPRLVDVRRGGASLATEAVDALSRPTDRREAWKGWKREELLNPAVPGEAWEVDPRHVQNAAARSLYALARRTFRRDPLSYDSLAAFAKLMQFEEDALTSVAEGLCLGISAREVVSALEVSV